MYPFSTGYVYFGQLDNNKFLKFNFILNPCLLVDNQQKCLSKYQYRDKIYEIVKEIASYHILSIVNSEQK
jgi:hypothetical protein